MSSADEGEPLLSTNGAVLKARNSERVGEGVDDVADPMLNAGLHWQREKQRRIEEALRSDPVDLSSLKELSLSNGGLLSAQIRKKVWPKLLGVNVFYIYPYEGPPLINHKERPQVLLDIHRCGKRIPPGKAGHTHTISS